MFEIDYPETSGVDEERARAALRIKPESIIRIMQHKGDSECRNRVSGVMGDEDELCNWDGCPLAYHDRTAALDRGLAVFNANCSEV